MGIPVRLHYTLWVVFFLIAWSLANGYMPHQYPGLDVVTYWVIGVASSFVLFVSVLLHELSHSYIAKRNGLPIARITLFFFGGVSEMSEEPQDPGLDVRMAAAGPLMSFLIGGILGGLWYAGIIVQAPIPVTATLGYGALINGTLGLFNLLPAFPLDGGRVFRGVIWKRSKNLVEATRWATKVSEAFSLLMMLGGIVAMIIGDFFNGIWIVIMGWFIKSGAETSLSQTLLGETLVGVSVGDIMTRNVLTVPPEITLQQLVSIYFLTHRHGGYPVIKDGQIVGLVTLQCVRGVPVERRPTETVGQAMIPRERTVMVPPTTSAMDVLKKMARARIGRVLVTDDSKLLGIVTRGDLMRTIHTRQELGLGTRKPVDLPHAPPQGSVKSCIQCGAQLPLAAASCTHCAVKQPQEDRVVT